MAVEMQDVRRTMPQVDAGRAKRGRSSRGRRPDDPYVFPAAFRCAGWTAIVGVTLAVAWLARSVHGEKPYLIAWVTAGAVFGFPGLVLAWWSGSHVDAGDRPMWRLWFVGFAATAFGAVALVAFNRVDWTLARTLWIVSIGVSIVAIGAGNMKMMRSRAGRRAALPDLLEMKSLVIAVMAPIALAVGDAVLHAQEAWFVLTWAVVTVALVQAVAFTTVLAARIRPEDRAQVFAAVALALAAVVESAGQVEIGIHGFGTGAGFLVAWHVVTSGLLFAFVLTTMRRRSVGLDRLPPQGQVRRTNVVSVFVLAAVPVLLVEAFIWSDKTWVVLGAAVSTAVLLVLSSLRHLLVDRETAQLYALVEQAADERRQLLADVLSHASADRHRVATRLHQQAMTSYSAMASFVAALERSPAGPPEAALGLAATRARTDLAQQVDTLRDVLATVAPPATDGEQRLVAPLRAYVDSLYLDGCKPKLDVVVDDDIVPDWTTEVIVLRIAQAAIDNVFRHAECSRIEVRVAARGRDVVVDIEDDGLGFDPSRATDGSGLSTMRMLARFIDGRVEVYSKPGQGTHVRAVLGSSSASPSDRPELRLITNDA